MALKMAYVFRGINIPEAYIRLDQITGGKRQGTWSGQFSIYQSEAAANPPQLAPVVSVPKLPDGLPEPAPVKVEPQPPLSSFNITAPWLAGEAPESLLYEAAKKQEVLSGAVDA